MQQDFFDSEPVVGKSFIYRSSAGSGKTFTLAKAYLKLVLLDPSRYNKILAITFTNKAKDEMKSRIIRDLTSLASGEESDIRTAILNEFEAEGYERIADVVTSRAALVLTSVLHDYSRFHVSTIDHFFTQLIRHLARELKLNLGYELDVDSTTALVESIDLLFKNADKELLKWLNDFALEQIENEQGWDIRKSITDLGGKLFQESYLDVADSLSKNISKLPDFIREMQLTVKRFRSELTEEAKRGVDAALKNGLVPKDFKYNVPLELMLKIKEGSYDFSKAPAARFLEATTLESWHTKASEKVELISRARDDGMAEAHSKIVNLYDSARYSDYLEANAVLRYIHSYGVLSALSNCLQEYRSDNNLMFVSDSAFVLHEVVSESETPFIYEKIGSEINYILIDEFQDTSAYQWKTLLPFFKSVLSNAGQVYVVGDVKQSIYGWRGGDLNLLLHQVETDLNVDESGIIKLSKNYRSAENIISFNNSFFKVASSILPPLHELDHFSGEFELAYHDIEQLTHKKYQGYVDIRFLNDENDNKWTEQSHEIVKKQISRALEDGFTKNDIMLLTRTTAEATRIANYLLEEGIAAISESALRLTSSSKVQLLIASLKFIINEKNVLALAEFNHFLSRIRQSAATDYLSVTPELTEARLIKSRPVYEALEELILIFNLNRNSDIYLLKFLDLALIQAKRGRSSIPDFLDWWDEQESRDSKEFSLSIPESEDAVIVLTVHKAKGLEKPVVILPYADDKMNPKSAIFWARTLPEKLNVWGSLPLLFSSILTNTDFREAYKKHYFDNLLESLNLLYVAFTRAGERLHIISKAAGTKTNSGKLIYEVLCKEEFTFNSHFDTNTGLFSLGEQDKKQDAGSSTATNTEIKSLSSYPVAEKLVIDKKQSEIFLEIAGEKSAKVREGIIIHEILSTLRTKDQLDQVINQFASKGLFENKDKASFRDKINKIFDEIPEMVSWFSNTYEVINERQIFFRESAYIPDRVMIKGEQAIIVDYKREVQDAKHKNQVRKYRDLLRTMGYTDIRMFLIYVDEPLLIEVDG